MRFVVHRGQAMVETVLAVLVITFLFLVLFSLSRLLMGKVLMEHAAMRVSRARAVGCNEFQCLKAARVAIIPVAGERVRPGRDDERRNISEAALAKVYMCTPDSSYADGLLVYRDWDKMDLHLTGRSSSARVTFKRDWWNLEGDAVVDSYPDYLR